MFAAAVAAKLSVARVSRPLPAAVVVHRMTGGGGSFWWVLDVADDKWLPFLCSIGTASLVSGSGIPDCPLAAATAAAGWLAAFASLLSTTSCALLLIVATECIRCSDVFVVTVVMTVELDGVPLRHEWCIGIR